MTTVRRPLESVYYQFRLLLLYLASLLRLCLYPEPKSRGPIIVYCIGNTRRPLRSEISSFLNGEAWWRKIHYIQLDSLTDRLDPYYVEPAAPYRRLIADIYGLDLV